MFRQKADILTKALTPRTHETMVRKIGLMPANGYAKTALLLTTMLVSLMLGACDFQVEDPVIWSKTGVSHVAGQTDMALALTFHDPCPALFKNLTGLKGLDKTVTTTCSRRFKLDIIES